MKKLIVLFALAFALMGCKHQYWIFNSADDGEIVAVVDNRPDRPEPVTPEPEAPEPEKPATEPEAPKEVIYILGINGMDWGQWATGVMDALLTRSGVIEAKTDITKAEIYLRTAPGTQLDAADIKREIENVFGYGYRSLEITGRKWEEFR